MYPTFSLIIICRNEERVIKRCLNAISKELGIDDEIVVVDTGSTDKTLNIISEFGNTVHLYHFKWIDDFAAARNFGINKATKDWIFFIDSDEVLRKNGLGHLREYIKKVEERSLSSEEIVFSPKIVNTNDTIGYNSPSIMKNNGNVIFEGCVHEYPILLTDSKKMVRLKLPDVILDHDGYEESVVEDKDKAKRNTKLIKSILDKDPNNARYYYFYYRDARPFLTDQEYEKGMEDFFEKFPNDPYGSKIAKDFALYWIQKGENEEAEKYIRFLLKNTSSENKEDHFSALLLTGVNEIGKVKVKQKEILQLLIVSQENMLKDEQSIFEKGYEFDALIGYLFFQLENYQEAKKIYKKLSENNYRSHLDEMFDKLKESGVADEV
ncbi:TPR domain-containing glycosyltransferase [Lactovum odontotermitis]